MLLVNFLYFLLFLFKSFRVTYKNGDTSIGICTTMPKGLDYDEIKKKIKEQYGTEIKDIDIKCSANKILIGFALLMYGMTTMSGSMSGLSSMPSFTAIINALSNPFLGLLTGIVVAAIMQSSSASIGILQALALSGSISFATVIPMVMGINIGQVVPVLIISKMA